MKGIIDRLASAVLASSFCFSALASEKDFIPFPEPLSPNQPVSNAYHKQSIEEVLSSSDDEELVKLSGQIIKKLKCSTYLFRDATGEIHVQIDNKDIPAKGLLFSAPTIIKGEVNRDDNSSAALQADKVTYSF